MKERKIIQEISDRALLPFSAIYWSATPTEIPLFDHIASRKYNTKQYVAKKFYKSIVRKNNEKKSV